MTKTNTIQEILKLHKLKTSNKEIARYLNVDEGYVAFAISNACPTEHEQTGKGEGHEAQRK